jgi:hypothetical protein
MCAELRQKTTDELKRIIEKDYHVSITDAHAKVLGLSLLRLARLAMIALARAEEKKQNENSKLSNS